MGIGSLNIRMDKFMNTKFGLLRWDMSKLMALTRMRHIHQAKLASLCLVLAISALHGFDVNQTDFETAFLNEI